MDDELPQHLGPPGHHVVLRRATSADVPRLRALYEHLAEADRYRRFFSGGMPSDATLTRWVTGPGNLVVVAERGGSIVADAGVARADDGRYELGIAVDPDHRGWLGPYLLDLVLGLAGRAGAPAVVADVLATNGPMLGLVGSRGTAILPSDDPAVVRLLLGSNRAVPGWPGERVAGRPRVLLELGAGGGAAAGALESAGYEVVTCRGPARTSAQARRWRCPVLDGEECPLVAGADAVVVVAADGRSPADAQVADALAGDDHPPAVLLRLPAGASANDVVESVEAAVDEAAVDTDRR